MANKWTTRTGTVVDDETVFHELANERLHATIMVEANVKREAFASVRTPSGHELSSMVRFYGLDAVEQAKRWIAKKFS